LFHTCLADCPVPELALDYWYKYNLNFETRFWPASTQWNVERQLPFYPENFAYTHRGVLFVGISLVGGRIHDEEEWADRQRADLTWITFQYNQNVATTRGITTMVVLANADPSIEENDFFFNQFLPNVQNLYTETQVLYIHRNQGTRPWQLEPQFGGVANLMVVNVEGSVWPPMLVEIEEDTGTGVFDQDSAWYDDFITNGGNLN
jgi:hypothetical protein